MPSAIKFKTESMATKATGVLVSAPLNVNDLLHPLDLAARQQLEKVPFLATAVKKYNELVADRRQRSLLLSSAVRLGPRQLPDIYKLLPPVCAAFGMDEPELYLMAGSTANAETLGHARPAIVIYSQLLEQLEVEQVQAVIAHECGHILADHVLYRQMALALRGGANSLGAGLGLMAKPAQLALENALLNWYQKSELTADRAAVAFMGGPQELQLALFHLLGVPKWMPGKISYAEFAAQADEFDAMTAASKWDLRQARSVEQGMTHPMPALRLREIQTWSESETFRRILKISQRENQGQRSCAGCGAMLTPDWRFCHRCGLPVAGDAGGAA